jgi:hypothetical protein
MKKVVTGIFGFLPCFALWADMTVTVDVAELSDPANLNQLYLSGNGSVSAFRGTKTFNLSDGDYEINTADHAGIRATYGSFSIAGTTLTLKAGAEEALQKLDETTIGFDTEKLALVTMDTTELSDGLDGVDPYAAMIALYGSTNTLRGEFSIYLPDREGYRVYTRKSDEFGTFDVIDGAIANVSGRLYQDTNDASRIHFDRSQLLPVRIMDKDFSLPEELMMVAVAEITPSDRLYQYITYMVPGTHYLVNRAYGGSYGAITITDNLSLSVDGYLEDRGETITADGMTYTEIGIDHDTAPFVDVYWSELSEPSGLIAAEFNNTARGVPGPASNLYYVADTKRNGNPAVYLISKYSGVRHETYGTLSIDANLGISVTGALSVSGSEIHFDTCALNKVTVSPTDGETVDVFYWLIGITEPVSFFVPDGTSLKIRVRSSATYAQSINGITAVIDGSNVVLSGGDVGDRLEISAQEGHCAPPDLDEDQVIDDIDECTDTPFGEKVDSYGCSIDQNIALTCNAVQSKNHGRYVSCVSHVLNDLIDQGMITTEEKGQIMSETAKK